MWTCITIQKIRLFHWFGWLKKKPCFWPIFPIFGAKNFFPRKSGSVVHNFIWVSSIMPKFRKNWRNENNLTDRRTDVRMDGRTKGQKDRQTLFYMTLPATAEGGTKNVIYPLPQCQTWQAGHLRWGVDHVVLWDLITSQKHISTSTKPMVTKLGRVVTYSEELTLIKLRNSSMTWFFEV